MLTGQTDSKKSTTLVKFPISPLQALYLFYYHRDIPAVRSSNLSFIVICSYSLKPALPMTRVRVALCCLVVGARAKHRRLCPRSPLQKMRSRRRLVWLCPPRVPWLVSRVIMSYVAQLLGTAASVLPITASSKRCLADTTFVRGVFVR